MMLRPEIDAVTSLSTPNTLTVPPPLIVTPAAGPVIVSVPLVLLSASDPDVNVIVWALAKTVGSKSIVFAPAVEFARPISERSEPVPLSAVLVTVNVDSRRRPSSAITVGRIRGRWRCRASTIPRRSQR